MLRDSHVDWVQGFKGERRDPIHRIIVGYVYQKFIKYVFRLSIRDVDCDFRFIRKEYLHSLNLKKSSGCITVELVKKLELQGAQVAEVQVSHYFRLHGKSQFFNFPRVATTLLGLGSLWWECFKLRNPTTQHQRKNRNSEQWDQYQSKMKSVK